MLVAALALVLVSCGGSPGGGAAGAAPKIGTIDIGATPAAQLRDGGTFRWALDLIPPNFNYNQVDGPSSTTFA
ncbi:MAG: hypothetical protein H0V41_14255 [Pseudonocardiales bacterium]|nr:hypothetical protein [Pseudonocardiales bacterium]